ncbi:MAG: hypothetical protein JWM28_4540 [Chitinophagaceae bacterium]|nr:hypothetical protein [Chitinophagaceae bacterium]
MELLDITLELLLGLPEIHNTNHNGIKYFCAEDINRVYDDGFQFTPAKMLAVPRDGIMQEILFISWADISEQVEHIRTKPSFSAAIDKILKAGKKY